MRLNDKVAIVTGGGSGIGRAIAATFVREGARVAICGRDSKKLEAAATAIGGNCIPVPADVSSLENVDQLVGATLAKFNRIDILVNNAGVLFAGTAESLREDQWEQTFDINVRSMWLMARAVLPHLRAAGGGAIINIGSVLSTLGARNRVAYTASKHAVLGLTRAMAVDHAAEKIRVNCICPGIVETEMVAAFAMDEATRKQRLSWHPAGRFGQPEDVAGLAVYLASDEASWVTGAAFPVDGGYSAM